MDDTPRVALVHDYLTQRGGAERVVLALVHAFPGAPLYTSLYDPSATFPDFCDVDVRTLPLNRVAHFRRRHRLALPFLAASFSRLRVAAEVTVCNTSGWAHGAHVEGRKVVYCHSPARWLYQTERYLAGAGVLTKTALAGMHPLLERWDRRAVRSADRYLANSRWVASEIKRVYGIEAEVLHPPMSIDTHGERCAPDSIEPGYVLCVSRLLPYKNVELVAEAMSKLLDERLVVVGEGPDEPRLRALAGPNVYFAGSVDDAELRWLYANARCLVAASYEDFGLTPIEAAAFGKPTAALRFGGFLDTVREHETGLFFGQPDPTAIAETLRRTLAETWDQARIRAHAASYSEGDFARRVQQVVAEMLPTATAHSATAGRQAPADTGP